MPSTVHTGRDALVLVDDTNGVTVIPQLSELRRLNWFDGKLLRADDLRVEQDHMRALVRRSNRAGGHGAVHGLTCTLGKAGTLNVSPGLAIDPGGRPLLLPVDVALDVQELIDRTASAQRRVVAKRRSLAGARAVVAGFGDCVEPEVGGQAPVGGARWYVVTVGWAEGLCGNEEVFGRLCEDACTTSTDRPWRIDGLVFRARPLSPATALVSSTAVALDGRHERCLLASALFADERAEAGSLIFADGLRGSVWCAGAAPDEPRLDEVALAVIGRRAATTTFLDVWTARRERMEPPPRRYWAGRMAMRPWDVFLAQVLQFQCQLGDLLDGGRPSAESDPDDPCAERQRVLESAIAELERRPPARPVRGEVLLSDDALEGLKRKMLALRLVARPASRRILVDGGIVELPPAGYLPVDPAGRLAIEDQVRALLGLGVDLTFCTTRADAVARALEEAQHLDRISLLQGLDNPRRREDVEIIVPDATLESVATRDRWSGELTLPGTKFAPLEGAGRIELKGALAMRWAGEGSSGGARATPISRAIREDTRDEIRAGAVAAPPVPVGWLEATVDRDPFTLSEGEAVTFSGAGDTNVDTTRVSLHGRFRIRSVEQRPDTTVLRGGLDLILVARDGGDENAEKLDDVDALLARRADGDGGTTVTLQFTARRQTITATLIWHGDADSVAVALFTGKERANGLGEPVGRLALLRDPAAATPGSPPRTSAEHALALLEKALKAPGYAKSAIERLFPPAAQGGRRLRATRDWVLFRRRAVLDCGGAAEAPAPVPVRTDSIAVYGSLDDTGERTVAPAFLGALRFRDGAAEVTGGADAVAGAWDDLAHGGTLVQVAIASGAPGGDALARRRAASVVAVLAHITAPAPGMEPQVVDASVLDLDARGADGVMVVAAVPAAADEVGVVALDPKMTTQFRRALEKEDWRAALESVFEIPNLLGAVQFQAGSAQPSDPNELQRVAKAYAEAVPGLGVAGADLFSISGDPAAGSENVRAGRADAIASELKGKTTNLREVQEDDFAPARARGVHTRTIVVVVPEAARARVITFEAPLARNWAAEVKSADQVPGALDKYLPKQIGLGTIGFEPGLPEPVDPDELARVAEAYRKALSERPVRGIVVIVEEGGNPDVEKVDIGRGQIVLQRLPRGEGVVQRFLVPEDALASRQIHERTLFIVLPRP